MNTKVIPGEECVHGHHLVVMDMHLKVRKYRKNNTAEYVEGPADMISKEEVRHAIQDLKVRKAAGPSGVTAEMIKAAGEQAVDWLTSTCNRMVKEEAIPESWQMSELVAIYKGKGDVLECSSSRGIKLLEHGMKVAERVLERRLRQAVEKDKMQVVYRFYQLPPQTKSLEPVFSLNRLYMLKNDSKIRVFSGKIY